MTNEDQKLLSQQAATVFADLLHFLIVDVASEAHRAARLGLDPRLDIDEEEEGRLSAYARSLAVDPAASSLETANKHGTDIFGRTHSTVAGEIFDCLNCGRPIMAGRFAPHLEKCMGKGRKARLKITRNTSSVSQRRARTSPISSYCSGAGSVTSNRTPNRTSALNPEDSQRSGPDANDGTSEESHEDDERVHPTRTQVNHIQLNAYY